MSGPCQVNVLNNVIWKHHRTEHTHVLYSKSFIHSCTSLFYVCNCGATGRRGTRAASYAWSLPECTPLWAEGDRVSTLQCTAPVHANKSWNPWYRKTNMGTDLIKTGQNPFIWAISACSHSTQSHAPLLTNTETRRSHWEVQGQVGLKLSNNVNYLLIWLFLEITGPFSWSLTIWSVLIRNSTFSFNIYNRIKEAAGRVWERRVSVVKVLLFVTPTLQ